ncbi:MAG: succinate dehydrogenase/fumarate reductase iron-sulfur subunit [Magnetococcales bacterium]|nr:succinate dehydrogenase/fumarate reductase iron-sulfur subunit [Magnetococcales bacterium]NGZ29453.1 succinate dehydrogenase/fumarate reductase iron-sulfur subunit [Magnetococcales bacterium]
MAVQEYTFRIQRNRRTKQGEIETRWQEFRVEAEATTTVLQALDEIRGHQDGTIVFRQSCRSAICGSCAMRINGRTRLACKTHVGSVAKDGVVELAPQANQPVLKDLAIDIGEFFKRVRHINPYIQEGNEAATSVTSGSYDQVNHVTQCIMCGCCYSDCTMAEVSPEFIGPAALAKAFRFVSDPREGKKTERLQQLSEEHMVWSCSRCAMCVQVCPKDVAPMEAIVKLRTRAMAKGYTHTAGAKHALAFHEDIQKSGDLNEFTLMMRTVGLFGTLKETLTALHLMKKGKIPSPFPHQAEGVGELGKIYQILEQNPLDVETKAKEVVPE